MGKDQGKDKGKKQYKNNRTYRAGYEYLLAYKLTVVIYDYTVAFVRRFVDKSSRTFDQMEQAARSGTANIAEGHKQESLKGYIKLSGVARGSLEELLKDYKAFARQRGLAIWPAEKARRESGASGKIGEIEEIWEILRKTPILPDNPSFPTLPASPEKAANLLITLISQANTLIDKLIASLKEKHMKEGGFTEKLYKQRRFYRGY